MMLLNELSQPDKKLHFDVSEYIAAATIAFMIMGAVAGWFYRGFWEIAAWAMAAVAVAGVLKGVRDYMSRYSWFQDIEARIPYYPFHGEGTVDILDFVAGLVGGVVAVTIWLFTVALVSVIMWILELAV